MISTDTPQSKGLALLFGGLLPVIVYSVIEHQYGIIAGLIAGMIFGCAEIVYELIRYKKVNTMTWIGNGMLLGLGIISLFTNDGIWFKMQPAIFEFSFFIVLAASWVFGKPFLKVMIEKQNPSAPEALKNCLGGLTLRLSFFFLIHALIATYAAFYWSTEAWAILKGVGLTVSMILYLLVEGILLKRSFKQNLKRNGLS